MSVALAFVTIERPHCAQRLVLSARRFLGDISIYVADQSADVTAMRSFYKAHDVHVVRMPFDAGLAASRNALFRAIQEKFVLLCDDDFVLGPCSVPADAISVLENAADIGVVGGRLHDYDGASEHVRNWEMFFQYDRRHRSFTATPIYNYAPLVRSVRGIDVYLCDAVLNFCVFRRSIFSKTVQWDELIKINGEHEDFYLNLKLNTDWKVGYLPTMAALHCHQPSSALYKTRLRSRQQGWQRFLQKWDLDQHLEIGTGTRNLDSSISDWFVGNADGSDKSRVHVVENALEYASLRPAAGVASMRLRTRESAPSRKSNLTDRVSSIGSFLNPTADPIPYDPSRSLAFSYAPTCSDDGLLVWYRPESSVRVGGKTNPKISKTAERRVDGVLRIRWFDNRGKSLVWESERIHVEFADRGYWRPILLPIPLWPAYATHLRFEVVAERGDERVPVALGFLCRNQADSQSQPEVVALDARWPVPISESAVSKALTLMEDYTATLEVVRAKGAPILTVDLAQPVLSKVSDLILLGWAGLGRHIARIEIPKGRRHRTVVRAALPADWSGRGRVLGLLNDGELRRFNVLEKA